jgi:nitrate reductase delta subunit
MTGTFKALSALLSYPTAELQQAAVALAQAIEKDRLVSPAICEQLGALARDIATDDLYDLQERYILLFDRTRSLSLHLFEHVHGESRDRGQAMIDLKNLYERHGLNIAAAELPDYLPLFLEFLSTRPLAEATELLSQPAHILAALAERLRKRKSPYEAAFRALAALDAGAPDAAAIATVLQEPDADPTDLGALDALWEEEPVTFGPSAAPSCKDKIIARVRAARRPAAELPA